MPHAVKQFGRFANEYWRAFVNDSSTPRQKVGIVWPRTSQLNFSEPVDDWIMFLADLLTNKFIREFEDKGS